jgi:mRNA interferase RelE/StbE
MLAIEPRARGCEKLSGQERYRVRQGCYRIIYEIREDVLVVVVVKIEHRKRVHRGA